MIGKAIKESFKESQFGPGDVVPEPDHGAPDSTLVYKLAVASLMRRDFRGKSPEEVARALRLEPTPEMIDLIGELMSANV